MYTNRSVAAQISPRPLPPPHHLTRLLSFWASVSFSSPPSVRPLLDSSPFFFRLLTFLSLLCFSPRVECVLSPASLFPPSSSPLTPSSFRPDSDILPAWFAYIPIKMDYTDIPSVLALCVSPESFSPARSARLLTLALFSSIASPSSASVGPPPLPPTIPVATRSLGGSQRTERAGSRGRGGGVGLAFAISSIKKRSAR